MCIVHHQQTQEYTASRAYSLALWIAPFSKGCNPGCLNGQYFTKNSVPCFTGQSAPLKQALELSLWLLEKRERFKSWRQEVQFVYPSSYTPVVAPDIFMGVLTFTQGSVCLFHFSWQAHSNLSLSALLLWVLPRVKKTKLLFPNSSLTTRQWYISIIISAAPFKKQPQKVSKIKESKRKQMTEPFRLARGTLQTDQRTSPDVPDPAPMGVFYSTSFLVNKRN